MQDFTAEEAREIYEVHELLESFALERVEQSNSGTLVDLGLNGRDCTRASWPLLGWVSILAGPAPRVTCCRQSSFGVSNGCT